MKQFIVLTIALLTIVSFNLWQTNYLKSSKEELNVILDRIKDAVNNDNFVVASGNVKLLNETWKRIHEKWDAFSDHQNVEEVSEYLTSLTVYITSMDKTNTLRECSLITEKLNHIVNAELVSIGTVF